MALCGLLQLAVGTDPVGVQAIAATTALAIGGGALLAGGSAGGLLSRPDSKSPGDFRVDADPGNRLLKRSQQLRDPSYGFQEFRKMAFDTAPSADQTLQATAAAGGSERLARVRQEQQSQQAANDIMERFGQFRLNASQQANQLLSQRQQGQLRADLQARQMAQKQNLARDRSTQSIFNNIAGIGGSLLGVGLGGIGGGAATTGAAQGFSNAPSSFGRFRQSQVPQGTFVPSSTSA
jgi:hypothetical protein